MNRRNKSENKNLPDHTEFAAEAIVDVPVFHGTNSIFEAFDCNPVNQVDKKRLGACLSTNSKFASLYGERLIEATLTLNRPFDITDKDAKDIIQALPITDRLKQELRSAFKGREFSHYGLLESAQRETLRESLERMGFDGIKYTEGYADAYIAFNSNKVRIVRSRLKNASSPSMKQWFGNSAVREHDGVPMPVYHGTVVEGRTYDTPRGKLPKGAFTQFDKKRLGSVTESSDSKVGFWFTSSLERAESAAHDAKAVAEDDCMSCFVYEVFLKIENPLRLTNIRDYDSAEVAKIARKAKRNGHDGLIFESGEQGGSDYLVFEPEQIKLTTATDSVDEPIKGDIRYLEGSITKAQSRSENTAKRALQLVDKQTKSTKSPKMTR